MPGLNLRDRLVSTLRDVERRIKSRVGHAVVTDRGGPRQPTFDLFAVVPAWNEGDVIADCVSNLFAQGCERVLLVDNASTDDTVARALGAGAELIATYDCDGRWVPAVHLEIITFAVDSGVRASGAEHVWAMVVDADEFPKGPYGRTVKEHIASLPAAARLVGSEFLNHFPTGRPSYVPGGDPLATQPMCVHVPKKTCPARHFKHAVFRCDPGEGVPRWSFHHVKFEGGAIHESETPILTHHLQYRDEELTRARLAEVARRAAAGGQIPARMRAAQVDEVYAGNWPAVKATPSRKSGVEPRPWPAVVAALGLADEGAPRPG